MESGGRGSRTRKTKRPVRGGGGAPVPGMLKQSHGKNIADYCSGFITPCPRGGELKTPCGVTSPPPRSESEVFYVFEDREWAKQ
eukprot:11512601-Heterocapsa_arctica.AAC.1